MRNIRTFAARLAASSVLAAAFTASASAQQVASLADMSLEELANIEITSVSRRAERLSDAAAAVYVITGEDIRRSGVTSLPEALRLAPNLQVARVDARQYAISARGFNNIIANKLLVLIDGRTVYTPLFSGVFWDAQDVYLDDVERIEVISGPGATLWGANAVNGVINVITRRAADTLKAQAFVGAGNRETGIGARYGTTLDADGALRIYAKGFDRDDSARPSGAQAADAWKNGQAGFRADWGTVASGFTLQGDVYQGVIDQAGTGDISISGANVLARWTRELAGGDRLQVQGYLDYTGRDIPGSFAEDLSTFDLELQHGLRKHGAHQVTWGGGHRQARDQVGNSATLAFLPSQATLRWTSLFIQDEIELARNLRFTAGAKVESNPYTGWEFLPSARIAWKPDARRLVWGAVSRAVRAPSRLDRQLFAPGQPPFVLNGGPGFRSEISNVLELGYRAQASARLSYSLTAFRSVHDHLRTLEPVGPARFVIGNMMQGRSFGIEAWTNWQAATDWRLSAGAVFLDQDLRFKPGSGDTNLAAAGNDPKRQFLLRSSLDMSSAQDFDITLRHVGALPNPALPSYTAVDARYGWRVRPGLEFSVTAQNLLDPRHAEFNPVATRSEFQRGVFVRLTWTQ